MNPDSDQTTKVLVNIDHVATLRNAREEAFPDPVHAAVLSELAGVDGIVFHLRLDQRHITERDVRVLKETVKTKLDFELSMNEQIVQICCDTKPDLATLVPEKREEITTESGLDVLKQSARISKVTQKLFDAGIEEVALFVDPELDQIRATADTGANCIELHTGDFALARTHNDQIRELNRLAEAAELAHSMGIQIHAGHGLDYKNYAAFKSKVPHVREVSIGFAVVARALFVGFEQAVREMIAVVKG